MRENYFTDTYRCSQFRNNYYSPSSYGMHYYGWWNWFPIVARFILEFFMDPMDKASHERLHQEILEGTSIDGYVNVGNEEGGGVYNFYTILGVITAMGILTLLGGIGYKFFGKKTPKDVQKTSVRVGLVPLGLFQIIAFVLVGLLLVIFSVNMWATFEVRRSDQTRDALTMMKEKYGDIVRRGNCEYEASITGAADFIKNQVTGFGSNITENFRLKEKMDNQLALIKKDQETVMDLQSAASQLGNQLFELKNIRVIKTEAVPELEDIVKVVKMAEEELGKIYKSFDAISADAKHLAENIAAQVKHLNKEVLSASDSLLLQLDDMKTRIKKVMESVHGAFGDSADWINTVGKRNLRTMQSIGRHEDALDLYIVTQLAVAIPSILAMTALAVGFLALSVMIAYPKALSFCPNGLRKARRFISFSFYAQCILIAVVAFCAGVGLYMAASLNAVCRPMYTGDYDNNQMEEFYKDIGVGTKFVDYEGNVYNLTFSDIVVLSESWSFTRVDDKDLLPSLSSLFNLDLWMKNVISKVDENPIDQIKFEDQTKITKKLKEIISEIDGIRSLSSLTTKSHIVGLVDKQIASFKRQLQSLSLPSLEPKTYPAFSQNDVDTEIAKELKQTMTREFGNYNQNFKREIYNTKDVYNAYMLIGVTMCANMRYPAAGVWLSGTLLSFFLLLSAVVLFKTANNLELNFDEEGIPVSVSTIYSPLVDDGKKATEREN